MGVLQARAGNVEETEHQSNLQANASKHKAKIRTDQSMMENRKLRTGIIAEPILPNILHFPATMLYNKKHLFVQCSFAIGPTFLHVLMRSVDVACCAAKMLGFQLRNGCLALDRLHQRLGNQRNVPSEAFLPGFHRFPSASRFKQKNKTRLQL